MQNHYKEKSSYNYFLMDIIWNYIMYNKEKYEKIKQKYKDWIWNRYSLYDNETWEIIQNILRETWQRIKIKLPFYKKFMIAEKVKNRIWLNYYWYLSYIVDSTLNKYQKVNPTILLEQWDIKQRAYYDFMKCMYDNNIIIKYKNWDLVIYYLNPYIWVKTETINTDIIKLFSWDKNKWLE